MKIMVRVRAIGLWGQGLGLGLWGYGVMGSGFRVSFRVWVRGWGMQK